MLTVTLYSRLDCHLCEQAESDLKALQEKVPHRLVVIDIDTEPALQKAYALEIPVVEVGPYQLKAPFTRQDLEVSLRAASDRKDQLQRVDDKAYQNAVARGQSITGADRFSYWFSRHYMLVFNLFLLLYVGLPFLAPVLKQAGLDGAANVVYKVYSPLCHQWGFRSWFLFGEQAAYPHEAAEMDEILSFEAVSGITDVNDPGRLAAREYIGDSFAGYKVALCERDVAIWGSLLLFGLIFSLTGRRIPQLHWLLWLLVGLGPVALDGLSQLVSQLPFDVLHSLLPYRESTPFLRTLTGFLFGFSTAWFAFPSIEESMVDTRKLMAKKFAVVVAKKVS